MARRGRGEGTVYQAKDGRWVAQVTQPDGRRKALYGKTQKEANAKRIAALLDIERGVTANREDRQTVAVYLASWLDAIKPRLVVESWENYEAAVRLHIVPELGKVRLAQLSAQRVQLFYARAAAKGLQASRVRFLHNTLHRALKAAVKLDLVPRNVCDLVDPPAMPKSDVQPLSPEQARAYLDAAQQERLAALFVLAVATGMRIGEVMALRWPDVTLDSATSGGKVRVNATLKWRRPEGAEADARTVPVWTHPKTASSRRQISIDRHVAAVLREHKARQRVERIKAGVGVWQETGAIFTDEIGRPLRRSAVHTVHRRILKRAMLPYVRPHAAQRHTAATLLLGQHTDPKVVSAMLGHSRIGTTYNLYAHVLPDMLEDAAANMAVALGW